MQLSNAKGRRWLAVMIVVGLNACRTAPGVIVGNVYFAGADGEGKRASGVTVRLLRDPDSLDTSLGAICRRHSEARSSLESRIDAAVPSPTVISQSMTAYYRQILERAPLVRAREDSLATLTAETLQLVNGLIDRLTVDSAVTGIDARFRFAARPSGKYATLARGVFAEAPHAWLSRFDFPARDSASIEMGPPVDQGVGFYCGMTLNNLVPRRRISDSEITTAKLMLETR